MFLSDMKKNLTQRFIIMPSPAKIFKAITSFTKLDFTTFDMTNNWQGSVNDFGSLNHIYGSTVLPGDKWKIGHNVLVKLPPLVAPSFTRIKGIVNTFYTSYSSVWNYWNSFISDRPEDVFLSRHGSALYRGKFVEPCVDMRVIALICKIAKGNCSVSRDNTDPRKFILTPYKTVDTDRSTPIFHDVITWTFDSSYSAFRAVSVASYPVPSGRTFFAADTSASSTLTTIELTFPINTSLYSVPSGSGLQPNDVYARSQGFNNAQSFFIYCCQQCVRNLENLGVPCDLIAMSSFDYYNGQYYNLLPHMCDSSVWHNFFRSEQNQSPEPDYREVNGNIGDITTIFSDTNNQPFFSADSSNSLPYGWNVRLVGIPPSVSTGSDYWLKVDDCYVLLSLLCGYALDSVVLARSVSGIVSDVRIIPSYINGLLFLKYRNFEPDYFTSASVDPNMGGVSVNVPSTIDALRTASKLEEYLERSTTASDFYHWMQANFHESPDEKYSRPLLLGTQVVPVQIGEQLQTSQTTSTSPLGERAGIADAHSQSGTCNHSFSEHGFVTSYLSFVIDAQYKDGMPHYLMHHKQFDYPFPDFVNLGAEGIPTSEIYFGEGLRFHSSDNLNSYTVQSVESGSSSLYPNSVDFSSTNSVLPSASSLEVDSGDGVRFTSASTGSNSKRYSLASVDSYRYFGRSGSSFPAGYRTVDYFGYTPRYSKWKFQLDVVAGQFRNSLDYWHTFRKFFDVPHISSNFVSYINASFVNDINRIFAVVNDNSDKFYIDIFNNASVRRWLPLVPDTTLD